MIKADKYLINTLSEIQENGVYDCNPRPKWEDGTPAHSKFITHTVETYNIAKGEFPIPTLRPTAIKTGIKEILWIYQKESNDLNEARIMGINWWDSFDVGNGTIGQAYGAVVKKYNLTHKLLKGMYENPFSRRHILNLYQESDSNEQDGLGGLNPCFYSTTWSIREEDGIYYVDVLLNARSSDYITAGFINRTQYTALAQMVCGHLSKVTSIEHRVGKLTVVTANTHIYSRHLETAKELLGRKPKDIQGFFFLRSNKLFWEYTVEDWFMQLPPTTPLFEKLEIAV